MKKLVLLLLFVPIVSCSSGDDSAEIKEAWAFQYGNGSQEITVTDVEDIDSGWFNTIGAYATIIEKGTYKGEDYSYEYTGIIFKGYDGELNTERLFLLEKEITSRLNLDIDAIVYRLLGLLEEYNLHPATMQLFEIDRSEDVFYISGVDYQGTIMIDLTKGVLNPEGYGTYNDIFSDLTKGDLEPGMFDIDNKWGFKAINKPFLFSFLKKELTLSLLITKKGIEKGTNPELAKALDELYTTYMTQINTQINNYNTSFESLIN